MHKAWLLKT